jgi:hypothetical protein
MKIEIETGLLVLSLASIRRLTLVFAAAFASTGFAAEAPSATAEPKTHTLFLGADLSVEQNQEIHRVQGIAEGAWVISVDGQEIRVPMDRGTIKLKVEPSRKLTESSAVVAHLKYDRTYTLANDPTANFLRGLAQSAQLSAGSAAAQSQAEAGFRVATIMDSASGAPTKGGSNATSGTSTGSTGQTNAQQNIQTLRNSPGLRLDLQGNPLNSEDNYDAMDVAFEVSSERPLTSPYLVIIVQYRVTDGKPGQVANWIYARALPPIGREARKVHIEQGGFPLGFELQDFQVHLYNRGEEIATTVAPQRVELTRDEAFQYVLGPYLSSHKGATLPATPAMGRLPADLSARVASGQLKPVYYVKVAKDGKVSATFADESCAEKVNDPYLEAVLKNFRFKPALDKGEPVDGVALLQLNQLPI